MSVPEYWYPYLYQYGVGFVIFMIGIFLILYHKSCNLKRQKDRFWFGVLIFGFIWYAGIHFSWYMAAIYVMPEAAANAKTTPPPPAKVSKEADVDPSEAEFPARLPGTGADVIEPEPDTEGE